jgi:RND family efflux transporter MFP subunit
MRTLLQRFAGALQLVFVVAVVGSAIMLSASMKPDAPYVRPKVATDSVPVTVIDPVATRYTTRVELHGVVEARTVTRIIPQVSGRIVDVAPAFRSGDRVGEGDILFVIDPADYELAVDRTLAEIEVARSELARLEAEAAAEREIWQKSFPQRTIPDLIARKPQIAAAKARIHSGEAARAAAELALSRTVVRAPFDARVLETRLDLGQVVNTSAAVGSIFSEASLEIAVPVSTDEMKRIGDVYGRVATIATPTGQQIGGKVVRKAATLDERTRLGTLFVESADPAALTLGEFVSVQIVGAETDAALRLPYAAMTSRDRLWVVDDKELVERRVEILGRDGDTLVVRPFDAADGVVAIPPAEIRAGLLVEPVDGFGEPLKSKEFASSGAVAGAAK